MPKSVPYLAALISTVLLICLSAHADTPTPACFNTIQGMPTCTAPTITRRRCSTAVCGAEPIRLSTGSASLDKGWADWHETC